MWRKLAVENWSLTFFSIIEKNKDHVDTVQSGTNSCVDCHFSKDGNRVWSLAENGEIMCFDLRQMRAVNCFNDMFGATSLCESRFIAPVFSTWAVKNLFNFQNNQKPQKRCEQ